MLKYINLSHNLISDLIQLNHLRLLTNITQILMNDNPVKLNLKCELIIKEILDVVALKQTIKNNRQQGLNSSLNWNSSTFGSKFMAHNQPTRPVISSPSRTIRNAQKASSSQKLNATLPAQVSSMPNNLNESYLSRNSKRQSITGFGQRKLKAHNVLIEAETTDDYYIVNSVKINPTSVKDSTLPPINENSQIDAIDAKFLSTSIGNYEPSKLQDELENLKKMRQNYGTDWLLSTPSLLDINKQLLNEKMSGNNIIEESKDEVGSSVSNNIEVVVTGPDVKEIVLDTDIQIVEAYAVYRSMQSKASENNNSATNFELEFDEAKSDKNSSIAGDDAHNVCLCIISLSEKLFIEKDETNTTVISANEFASLEDIILLLNSGDQ
jgi:hypothetical protein